MTINNKNLSEQERNLLNNPFGAQDRSLLTKLVNSLDGQEALEAIAKKYIAALDEKNWDINTRPPFNTQSPLVGIQIESPEQLALCLALEALYSRYLGNYPAGALVMDENGIVISASGNRLNAPEVLTAHSANQAEYLAAQQAGNSTEGKYIVTLGEPSPLADAINKHFFGENVIKLGKNGFVGNFPESLKDLGADNETVKQLQELVDREFKARKAEIDIRRDAEKKLSNSEKAHLPKQFPRKDSLTNKDWAALQEMQNSITPAASSMVGRTLTMEALSKFETEKPFAVMLDSHDKVMLISTGDNTENPLQRPSHKLLETYEAKRLQQFNSIETPPETTGRALTDAFQRLRFEAKNLLKKEEVLPHLDGSKIFLGGQVTAFDVARAIATRAGQVIIPKRQVQGIMNQFSPEQQKSNKFEKRIKILDGQSLAPYEIPAKESALA